MEKFCPVCEYVLKDGDKVVACMVTTYRAIDSGVTFALEHPSKCIEVVHEECFDYEDVDDVSGGMELQ